MGNQIAEELEARFQKSLDRCLEIELHHSEVAQGYARGGIQSLAILNGGAAVAVLSQLPKLLEIGIHKAAAAALLIWCLGLGASSLVWMNAFASSRYAARAADGTGRFIWKNEVAKADNWQLGGQIAWGLGWIFFIIGALVLIFAFISIDPSALSARPSKAQ